ncbi:hypothetical protein [Candidatus Amoebophilus asiaticus]|uniref:hypothetical protein n=1 Tax=Candidatus Amoebophilus asiaticus TaxID=281120 RepID=UPI00017150B1|nr:hypothetical protein [Candidatus Amoebophilus asiaticus]
MWEVETTSQKETLIIEQIKKIRGEHPSMGGRKLHHKLQNFIELQYIKLGRDKLFDLLARHYLLVRKRKRHIKTTQSLHRFKKYPNQIKGFCPSGVNQL